MNFWFWVYCIEALRSRQHSCPSEPPKKEEPWEEFKLTERQELKGIIGITCGLACLLLLGIATGFFH